MPLFFSHATPLHVLMPRRRRHDAASCRFAASSLSPATRHRCRHYADELKYFRLQSWLTDSFRHCADISPHFDTPRILSHGHAITLALAHTAALRFQLPPSRSFRRCLIRHYYSFIFFAIRQMPADVSLAISFSMLSQLFVFAFSFTSLL